MKIDQDFMNRGEWVEVAHDDVLFQLNTLSSYFDNCKNPMEAAESDLLGQALELLSQVSLKSVYTTSQEWEIDRHLMEKIRDILEQRKI